MKRSLLLLFFLILVFSVTNAQLPVFPGAEGFGRFIAAGRGGQVIKVTNLNDAGPGSLRSAVQTAGARIIVFEVGGEINLNSSLNITEPFITIAGQTAPSPGITLSGYGIKIWTHDLLMQHIFVRHTEEDGADAIDCHRNGDVVPYNIVIDHVSVSWGRDENLSFAPGGENIMDNNSTFSNNIVAEGLGGYGTLISDGSRKFSAIKNLWISHRERQPRIKGGVSANIINNVSYNIGSEYPTAVGPEIGPNYLNLIGNVHLAGPSTPNNSYQFAATKGIDFGSQIYASDNKSDGGLYNSRIMDYLVDTPTLPLDGVSIVSSSEVVEYVVKNAGARPAERDGIIANEIGDPVDERLISEVKSQSGSVKSSIPEFPIPPSTFRAFTVPNNPNNDDDGNGYTNIEEVLQLLAAEVEGRVITSVTDPKIQDIKIYPNPASTILTVQMPLAVNDYLDVTINSLSGERISRQKTFAKNGCLNLDISELKSGMYYLVQVDYVKGLFTSKFVKK
tara:strand:+ start:13692 stop:15206 length:1515 start_codon:yes stop_codon:yes gene_type:complete